MSQPGAATERRLIEIIRRAVRKAPGVRMGIGDDCAVLEPGGTISFFAKKPSTDDVRHEALMVELAGIRQELAAIRSRG